MAKCHILVDTTLQCPVNSKRGYTGDGYISLVAHLTKFSELGQIPMNLDIARLNGGGWY